LAWSLATVGKAVFDGNALAVSVGRGAGVKVSVGAGEAVCVRVGARTVFVGVSVTIEVGAIGVAVSVQASEIMITGIKKNGLCFIAERSLLGGYYT
jgi:hypothetical protein